MRLYEGILIFPPESNAEARKKQLDGVEKIFSKNNAAVKAKSELGRKPMGYTVKKNKEGYFVLFDLETTPESIAPIKHALGLEEELLKFMVTRKITKVAKPKKQRKPKKAASPAKAPEPAATAS